MTIKVYTVAGRLVREIKVTAAELRFGFNSILWDGRDQDGGELANGVYFYKIVMHVEDHAEEVVQKMARIR
jgi:flagellar hook assembly protein FlgD